MGPARCEPGSECWAGAGCPCFGTALTEPFRAVRTDTVPGEMKINAGCEAGSSQLLRKALKVLPDTAILVYLAVCVSQKDNLGSCSLGIIHIDF